MSGAVFLGAQPVRNFFRWLRHPEAWVAYRAECARLGFDWRAADPSAWRRFLERHCNGCP